MARIVVGGYMVRHPAAGMLSGTLQYLLALRRLGHEVVFVERAGYPDSCWNPAERVQSDDCRYGVAVVAELLQRFGVEQWCYVDAAGASHGPSSDDLDRAFAAADAFFEIGLAGEWAEETSGVPVTVLVESEPGMRHIQFEEQQRSGEALPRYDHYFTNGCNVGTPASIAPTAGITWQHLLSPVDVASHLDAPIPQGSVFSTVMNWQSHSSVEFDGATYGQKDLEFPRFERLPSLAPGARFEIAVSGLGAEAARLEALGWHISRAHDVSLTYDGYVDFIDASVGEFSVSKNVFVALRTGWFSERSAVYLARGRPVVLQDTGFSDHLPVGEGLFAVETVEEAAAAVDEVLSRPARHREAAREIAREHLDGPLVLGKVLATIGVT